MFTTLKRLEETIQNLKNAAKEFNLIINYKKSGIFLCKQKNKNELKEVEGIPVVQEYKYLGILINNKGKLNNHIRELQLRAVYLK